MRPRREPDHCVVRPQLDGREDDLLSQENLTLSHSFPPGGFITARTYSITPSSAGQASSSVLLKASCNSGDGTNFGSGSV